MGFRNLALSTALLIELSAPLAQAQTAGDVAYAQREDWSKSNGQMNISTFTYRDLNENGIYDLGDRPMAALIAALAFEGEGVGISMSNANGYANFTTSSSSDEAMIHAPGAYIFEVVIPPGWRVTSGNHSQKIVMLDKPGSAVGLELAEMLVPIGLAPIMTISGTWGGDTPETLRLFKGSTEIQSAKVAPGEVFSFPAPRGNYTLSGGAAVRFVRTDENPVNIGTFKSRAPISATQFTANFDNLSEHGLFKIPSGYLGLGWRDLNMIKRDFTPGSLGYVNGVTSGDRVAYTTNGRPGQVLSEAPFDFVSAALSIAWREAEGQIAIIEMWRGEEKLVEDRLALSVLGPVIYAPEIPGVTRVQITPEYNWQLVIDDLTVAR